jgi:hypothetical protein
MDLDLILIENSKIISIVENKYYFKNNINNILNKDYYQRLVLLDLCEKLNCKLLLNEISTDTWIYIKSDNSEVRLKSDYVNSKMKNFIQYNSENKIYLEIRLINNHPTIKSIMYIDEMDSLIYNKLKENYDLYKINIINKMIKITNEQNNKSYGIYKNSDWKKIYSELNLL